MGQKKWERDITLIGIEKVEKGDYSDWDRKNGKEDITLVIGTARWN